MEKILCGYLSGCGTVFLPETWRDGAVCVTLTGEPDICRTYVDGSYRAGIPFEVCVRCPKCTDSVEDKLKTAEFFMALTDYIRNTSMPVGGWRVLPSSGKPSGGAYRKAAVYDDGTEEYRAGYILEIYVRE